jgi:cytochrome P450
VVFNYFKAASLVTSTRFYPFLEKVMRMCLSAAVIKRQDHFQSSEDKIHRQLERATKSVDTMSYVLDPNVEGSMSIREIETTFNILIIAGSETTASALSGTTNYLLRNPATLAKLAREIRGTYEVEAEINLSTLGKLPYLSAVIEEGLRMAPPVPSGLPRVVPKGGGKICGEWLPEGVRSPCLCPARCILPPFPPLLANNRFETNISLNQWAACRSPLNFTEPDKFLLERWLQSDEGSRLNTDGKKTLQPFSFGPRDCIGKNLAYAELRLIIARRLQ